MTIAEVSSQRAGSPFRGSSSGSVSAPNNLTAGSLLVVTVWSWKSTNNDPFVVGDISKSAGSATLGAFSLDVNQNQIFSGDSYLNTAVFSALVTGSGSCTIQIAGMPANAYGGIAIDEFSGSWDASRLEDTSAQDLDSSGNAPNSGNATSAGAALFVGACGGYWGSNPTTFTPDSPFTNIYSTTDGAADHCGAGAFAIVGSGTTDAASWAVNNSQKWQAVVAVYAEAAGGGTTYDETISEGVTVGESSAVGVTVNATLTETATAGETSAALVTAEASLTETATVGESSEVAATINAGTSEGVTPGDSYVSDPVTYDETISEGVTLGDSYATDGPAVSAGGSRRRPRREPQWDSEPIRPEQMPPYEASILVRQPSQNFSLGVEVSTAVDVEFEQDAVLIELAAESGDEVTIEMQAAAQFVDALLATVPMRKAQAPTFAKLAPMLVQIEIEQAEQIEYEIA